MSHVLKTCMVLLTRYVEVPDPLSFLSHTDSRVDDLLLHVLFQLIDQTVEN